MRMFYGWQAFYQVTGSAAGALIGLLFIVATLSAGRSNSATSNGARLFTTPTVFHLGLVLMISALALMPVAEGGISAFMVFVGVMIALGYSAKVLIGLARLSSRTHWSDIWFYGVAPMVAYVGLAAASVGAMTGLEHAACAAAVMLLALLMLSIRNAWDLVTWLSARFTPDIRPSQP